MGRWLTVLSQASSGVVEVLVRTGGFSTKVLLHRLFETFQWLLQCTDSVGSIQPGGSGHASTIRVRLLHASVRQRILKLTASRPAYYDVDRFGVPVNTLDSIHSISTFCANPMWQQLPRQGIWPRPDEIADYVALFRYLGYLLATPPEYFDSPSRAKAVMESMLYHELAPSATSKVVGYNFVECLSDVSPMNISREFIEAGSRWMNGREFCDLLGLGRPGMYYYALMGGQCMLCWALCWAQRALPALDRWIIAVRLPSHSSRAYFPQSFPKPLLTQHRLLVPNWTPLLSMALYSRPLPSSTSSTCLATERKQVQRIRWRLSRKDESHPQTADCIRLTAGSSDIIRMLS